MSRCFFLCLVSASAFAAVLPASAQAQAVPLQWSLHVRDATIQSGQTFLAELHAVIPFGWHLYSLTQPAGGPMATSITVLGTGVVMSGPARARQPDTEQVKFSATTANETYDDSVTFVVPLRVEESGTRTIQLVVRFQACSDRYCANPRADTVRTRVRIQRRKTP